MERMIQKSVVAYTLFIFLAQKTGNVITGE